MRKQFYQPKTDKLDSDYAECRGITNVVSIPDSEIEPEACFHAKFFRHCGLVSSSLVWLKICRNVFG